MKILSALCLSIFMITALIAPACCFSQMMQEDQPIIEQPETIPIPGADFPAEFPQEPIVEQSPPRLVPVIQPVVQKTSGAASAAGADTISLDIKGMDISDVLKMLANRTGMNMVLGKNVTGRVTLFLKDVDIADAFEIIILANDLAYVRKAGIVNIMTQRDYELQFGERFQDKKEAKVIPLKYAKAAELSQALTQIKTNIGRVIVSESSNTLTLIDIPEKIKEMELFIQKTDMPVQTRIFSLNYAQAEKLSAKLTESVTKGIGSIKIDERTNKIAITDYPEKLDDLEKIIVEFDEKTPQVLIDAQIVEISPEKNNFSMGVDWDYWIKNHARLVTTLPGPSLGTATPSQLLVGLAASDNNITQPKQYKATLDMLQVIGKTKILSSPRIMALNNQEAKILVGTKEAYITSATSQSADTAITSQTVNFVDVGIKLYVTPTINHDEYVTMKIKPEISSAERTSITSQGETTQIPIVTTSETETTIMVKNGTTIIIAGLKKDKHEQETRKIPFFGDIPLLGYFAKNTTDQVTKTELVIFITPHIVSGDEPLEYTSLTKDKDIGYIQSFATLETKPSIRSFGDYQKAVFEKLQQTAVAQAKDDPALEGEVKITFMLDAFGKLVGLPQIAESSQNNAVDEQALACVKKASPFPAFPKETEKTEETFTVSLKYP